MSGSGFSVVEASVADLRTALEGGTVTSVELVAASLGRIATYDRRGIRLNAVPVLSPTAFADAAASDERRRRGVVLGPLDGIPYTAKASYAAAGLPLTSGSPAFADLVAREDAFTIGRLRAAGAVLVGLTNMPPMADGGMQRGLYGRAESPYNADFLPAAFVSGSSNGSGAATSASFAAFGLGEETWSSGRAPASNGGLVAYTPSRGVISMRGNWPLYPSMDVVVPHARSVADLLEVLEVIVADDPDPRGDFWRVQPHVALPAASEILPASYRALRDAGALRGKVLGVPRMYINADPDAGDPIDTRDSVIELWEEARRDLEALGATVVEVDFPLVENDEQDRTGAASGVTRGILPAVYLDDEVDALARWAWDDFLARNGQPGLAGLADVDGARVFPIAPGEIPDRLEDPDRLEKMIAVAHARGPFPLEDVAELERSLTGLEEVRRIDLEDWMAKRGLDALVFPTNADVAPADADRVIASNDIAVRNGVGVSNGNAAIRRYGVPTVTVPMGVMDDTGMPVGLTFAGRAYSDNDLLRYADAFESSTTRRRAPGRTPELAGDVFPERAQVPTGTAPVLRLSAELRPGDAADSRLLVVTGDTAPDAQLTLAVDGHPVEAQRDGGAFTAQFELDAAELATPHSPWRGPYGTLVVALATAPGGVATGALTIVGGV
ncbi:MAG: amidase [Naasia sp.]|nr:amidase [Naasia sp.]